MENEITTVMPDLTKLVTELSGLVNSGDVLEIMGVIIGGTVGIYLTWKFGRKLVRSFLRAITGGRISF